MTSQPPQPVGATVRRVKHSTTLDNGFVLIAYAGNDGATVIELETHGAADAPLTHTDRDEPIARVYVNDGIQYDRSPQNSLPGSDDANEKA